MRENGFVFRTGQRNHRAELVVNERPIEDYAEEYGDEPAGGKT
jgi:hypothetical protein